MECYLRVFELEWQIHMQERGRKATLAPPLPFRRTFSEHPVAQNAFHRRSGRKRPHRRPRPR